MSMKVQMDIYLMQMNIKFCVPIQKLLRNEQLWEQI